MHVGMWCISCRYARIPRAVLLRQSMALAFRRAVHGAVHTRQNALALFGAGGCRAGTCLRAITRCPRPWGWLTPWLRSSACCCRCVRAHPVCICIWWALGA